MSCTLVRVWINPCFAVAGHFDALWLFLELVEILIVKKKEKKKTEEDGRGASGIDG